MIASAGTQLPSLAGRVAARLQNDMPFFIDLTEFVHRPHRSGIQRLGRELCRYWPGLIPAFLHGGRLVALPPETLEHMDGFFAAAAMPPERITALTSRPGQPVPLDSPDTRVVVTEVFYDTVRVQFYRSLSRTEMARCCFVVPDILPLTNPEFFPRDIAYEQIYSYFSLLVDVPNRAFISRHTRQVFFERLARGQAADGPVLRLGSNGLGERPDTAPDVPPPQFTAVGTVEPRKGHLLALDAFESLLPEIPELSLTFFGRLGWVPHRDADRLRRAQSAHPSFLWQEEADDETIRRGIERSRATLFLSAAEGFGLPPVESLYLGVPVIASRHVPSLEDISGGVRFVDELNAEAVRSAMKDLCDPAVHRRLAEQARALVLPTWAGYAEQVREWVTATAAEYRTNAS